MDGVLLIDKPSGPTSHDVVSRVRRSTGERRIGHTGTLDPRATGLLPLVLGQATRLASLLTGQAKTYDATVRFGWSTDTDDADGAPLGDPSPDRPSGEALAQALGSFAGEHLQVPPRHSAKKLAGQRAYDLARRQEAFDLAPVPVVVDDILLLGRTEDTATIRVTASTGFYVRALARDLGARLGCGAHLDRLRRIRVGTFDVADALPLEEAEALGAAVEGRLLSPAAAVGHLPSVVLNDLGLKRARHGNSLSPEHLSARWLPPAEAGPVRVLASDGRLVALAQSRGGVLHPTVVLGYD